MFLRAASLTLLVTACAASPAVTPASALSPSASAAHSSRVRSADGVELAAVEAGPADAPTIVFVHGLGFSHEVWHRQLEGSLATRFHLVAYDLRGHGQSSRPTDDVAYEDGARWGEDLAAVLAATAHGKPAVVVGWSLGGLPIDEYIRLHGAAAIAGAVYVDAVTKFAPELFPPTNAGYVEPLRSEDDAARKAATERFISACTERPIPAAELAPLLAAAGVLPASEHRAIQHMNLGDIETPLRALHKPALVIQGKSDPLLATAMARYTAALIPGAELSIYERSGHAPFLDETARFDQQLAAFADRARAQ